MLISYSKSSTNQILVVAISLFNSGGFKHDHFVILYAIDVSYADNGGQNKLKSDIVN